MFRSSSCVVTMTVGVSPKPARSSVSRSAALGPRRLLGYYSGVADLHVKPGEIAHWLGTDAMLLAYVVGFAFVPGAVAGIASALGRPRSREECGEWSGRDNGQLWSSPRLYPPGGGDRASAGVEVCSCSHGRSSN